MMEGTIRQPAEAPPRRGECMAPRGGQKEDPAAERSGARQEENGGRSIGEEQAFLKPGERIDDLQRNRLRIIQNPALFSFGMDAVLLSDFAKAGPQDRVLDLGTGTGIIPLLMSAKTQAVRFTGLEILHETADMARRSVRLNGLEDRIEILEGDIREADALLAPASFDVITSNPPYIPEGGGLINPSDAKAIARHELLCTLEDLAGAAERMLRPGGHCFLVHRPFRLAEVLSAFSRHGLEPKRLRLVYPFADREPDLFLLECVRGARPYLHTERPLIVWREPGVYTEELEKLYGF